MDINKTYELMPVLSQVIESLPQTAQSKIETILNIGQILIVIVMVYFILLIISKILSLRTTHNISKISANVEQINDKLDNLIKKKKK